MNRNLSILCLVILGPLVQPFAQDLRIACASNLAPLLSMLEKPFIQAYPEYRLVVNYGASGILAAQIRAGAQYSVFLSADLAHPQRLYEEGYGVSAPYVYARGLLVLAFASIIPGIAGLENLLHDDCMNIALPKPELAPYGNAAKEALEQTSLFSELEQRLIWANNVSQAHQFFVNGAVDAVFVPLSYVLHYVQYRSVSWILVERSLYRPIDQAALIVRNQNGIHSAARHFIDFLASTQAKDIIETSGYEVPGIGVLP